MPIIRELTPITNKAWGAVSAPNHIQQIIKNTSKNNIGAKNLHKINFIFDQKIKQSMM